MSDEHLWAPGATPDRVAPAHDRLPPRATGRRSGGALPPPPHPTPEQRAGSTAAPGDTPQRPRLASVRRTLAAQPLSAWVVAALTFLAYALLSTQQWRRFESPSYDLGIFTQLLQRYAAFQAPIVTVKGPTYNLLGDHFHPLLAVLAPIYAAFPSAYTLLMLQALLLAASAFFVAKTAHEHLGRGAGWLMGLAYAFSWGVQQAANVQFHEVALGAPILAISLWLLLRQSWTAAAIWGGLLVFVKEDLCLTVVVLGLVLMWRSRRLVLGSALALWGLVWTVLTFKVILPGLNPDGQYDHGESLKISTVLADPVGVIGGILTTEKKMATLLLLCVCVMFLLLRSEIALLVLPTLAWRFLSANEGHWGQTWHYSLMLMPTAYAAAIDACVRLRASRWAPLRGWGLHGPAMALAVTIALFNQMPLWQLRDPARWELNRRHAAARAAVDLVGKDAIIASDVSLMNQLVARGHVYYIGNKGNPVADWIVIDNVAGGWNMKVDGAQYASQIHPGTRWQTVLDAEGYQVVRRVG
ncbi:DUF2079 domain-containing protein [Mariniluteicoccus flavus]